MNILFVSSQFPNAAEPNRGIFSLQIARELAGFAEVRVVAPVAALGPLSFLNGFKKHRTTAAIPEHEIIGGLKVHHPQYFAMPGLGCTHAWSMYQALEPAMRKLHEQWHIDGVNCHWVFPDGVAMQRICRDLAIPVVLTPLGTDLNSYSNFRFRRKAIAEALKNSDRVSVLCSPMYQRCVDLGVAPTRLKVIPNGVDLQMFTIKDRILSRQKVGIESDGRVIMFIGSLVPVKGVASLLDAFAGLRRRTGAAGTKLYLVGAGFLEESLRRKAAELGIAADTVFVGAIAHSLLPEWINSADCLCLPSHSEGHPNVVMEALACGVPVVASAVGSVPEFVTPATGHLISPNDVAALAEKLHLCLSTVYDREKIRGTVAAMSWKSCAFNYYGTLAQLLPAGGN